MKDIDEAPVKDEVSVHYRLHGSPDSANLVVRMVLEELGEAYEYVPVDRLISEQKSETYRKLNPQGLIPVLEVQGQDAPLFETGAIIQYLADRHGAFAPEPASPERGRFLKWLFFISNTLHADLRISFKPHRYVADRSSINLLADALTGRIASGFQQLEQEIAATGGPYLLGRKVTGLDHYLAACARWAQLYGRFGSWPIDTSPRIKQLLVELEKRPAVRQACRLEMIEGSPFVSPSPVTLPGITA
ncbi:glutathione S-transferase family protein [Roseibium sp. SCP14]|uniref:glutathione S-transferase family protein n=1 Tax=Roseibium sp. SCP14 TaxID=3141375 RepID=UPI003338D5F4